MNADLVKEPKISVALAAFNGAHYLSEQVESLLQQTVPPDEIVICDDGSVDTTTKIAEKYRSSYPDIFRILRNTGPRGFSSNFNMALSCSTGDIVFICDQDDVWLPNKIECYLERIHTEKLSQNDIFVLMSDMKVVDQNLELILESIIEGAGLSDKDFTYGCSMAVSRKLLDCALPIPFEFIQHDVWLNLLVNLIGIKHVIKQPLMLYRRHSRNVTTSLAGGGEKIVEKIGLAQEFRIRMQRQEKVLRCASSRIETMCCGVSFPSKQYELALQHLRNSISVASLRSSGCTFERLVNFRNLAIDYKRLGIPFFLFLKDTALLNSLIQRNMK